MPANRSWRLPKPWRTAPFCAGALAVVLLGAPRASLRAQDGVLLLPLRITASASNMAGLAPGTSAGLDIQITRWSDAKERATLIAAAVDNGQTALLEALRAMPFHGHISIPRWAGADPHNVRLGWDLRYALNTPLEDGAQRIDIATDRYVPFSQAGDPSRPVDYPFTFIEIRVDRNGRGSGKIAAATRIEFDRTQNRMVLENYADDGIRLKDVRIVNSRKGKS